MEQDKLFRLKRIWYNISYAINRVLFPPAKVMFVIWTLSWVAAYTSNKIVPGTGEIIVIIVGYVVYCGLADLIYLAFGKKYLRYQAKIIEKHIKRLHSIMEETDPIRYAQQYPNGVSDSIKDDSYYDSYRYKGQNERLGFYNNNYDYMSGVDFELFSADLLRKLGFVNVETTKASGDHGIDILAEKDDVTYAIQCKCYSSNIGNAAVQQALTGKQLYRRDIAVVLTNQYFTAQAKEEANALGVKLWDRDKLNEIIRTVEQR